MNFETERVREKEAMAYVMVERYIVSLLNIV
jgi:hypothetical protein